jgi:hypothetical protein
MGADYRPPFLTDGVQKAIADSRALVRLGYPWWLRPFMARNVIAITLGRRIYLNGAAATRSIDYLDRLLRHELAHVRQVQRHGLIGFLVRYVTEYLRLLWRTRSMAAAYREISFEIEARAAERL